MLVHLFVYCFTSYQQLRSYQDWCRFVIAYSWLPYSAAPLGDQVVSTMTWYPTKSHYSDTEPTNPYPNLIMSSTWLGSDKWQFDRFLVWVDHGFEPKISRTRDPSSSDSATAPVVCMWCIAHYTGNIFTLNFFVGVLVECRPPVGQHYKVTMRVYCHKSVPVLIWP